MAVESGSCPSGLRMLDRHRLRRIDAVALPPMEKRMLLPLSKVESSMVTVPVVVMLITALGAVRGRCRR